MQHFPATAKAVSVIVAGRWMSLIEDKKIWHTTKYLKYHE